MCSSGKVVLYRNARATAQFKLKFTVIVVRTSTGLSVEQCRPIPPLLLLPRLQRASTGDCPVRTRNRATCRWCRSRVITASKNHRALRVRSSRQVSGMSA